MDWKRGGKKLGENYNKRGLILFDLTVEPNVYRFKSKLDLFLIWPNQIKPY